VKTRTSFHDTHPSSSNPSGSTASNTIRNANGEFVEYFSVPVPGAAQTVETAPLAAPPPEPAAALPTPPDVNNVYWQNANSPYPFGIVDFQAYSDSLYGGYDYPGYGYPGYGYGYGYPYGFRGTFHHGGAHGGEAGGHAGGEHGR
jgi:hypothetical protein